jgi:glycogen synthase
MVCDPWMLDGPQRDPWTRRTGAGPDLGGAEWLFVSRALREQVGGTGEVVPAGIEPALWPPASPRPWAGRLLCAGRLSRLKAADTALDALAHLDDDVRLAIAGPAGDPAYAAELRARADHRVTFEPARAPEAMAARYAAADAVLFPVRWPEPWGLVPLEAMAVGRPVIASGTGGSAEYLRDGVNALVCGRDDPAALAAAVRRLAGDPALRARLVAGGRETAAAHPAGRSHAAVREALERAARRGRLAARL